MTYANAQLHDTYGEGIEARDLNFAPTISYNSTLEPISHPSTTVITDTTITNRDVQNQKLDEVIGLLREIKELLS